MACSSLCPTATSIRFNEVMLNLITQTPWSAYWRLARLDRPAGIYLLLWPTLTALWLAAQGHPSIKMVLIFSLGVWIMRAAGGVINDYIDRDLDRSCFESSNRLTFPQGIQANS